MTLWRDRRDSNSLYGVDSAAPFLMATVPKARAERLELSVSDLESDVLAANTTPSETLAVRAISEYQGNRE